MASIAESPRQGRHNLKNRIELTISPGRSLGPFRLGASLWDIIQYLRERPQYFPTVELKYSHEEPLRYDVILALPPNGINLRFDGSLQRLKSIECFDPEKLKLVYQNSEVSSNRTIPTFLLIYKSFGPTYPGEFDVKESSYTLKYPGLSFVFPIPTKYQDLYKSSTDLPLEFPDGTTPSASRLYLYHGSSDWKSAPLPPLSKVIAEHNSSKSSKHGKIGRREIESLKAEVRKGVVLCFPTHEAIAEGNRENPSLPSPSAVSILLHVSTAQDILADLGKPSRVFYKEEDKMKIHSAISDGVLLENESKTEQYENGKGLNGAADEEDKENTAVQTTDYFLNYFHLGIDILIDGALHVCKKIVLHGNIPGHYDFQRYKRCPFQLDFSGEDIVRDTKATLNDNVLVDVESDTPEHNALIVKADMKIDIMEKIIPWESRNKAGTPVSNGSDSRQQKPVILTRGSSEQNPFGSTHLRGFDQGIVLEVMKSGNVPTVVLF